MGNSTSLRLFHLSVCRKKKSPYGFPSWFLSMGARPGQLPGNVCLNPSSRVQGLDRGQADGVIGSYKDNTEGTELVEVAVNMVWCFQFCGE